MTSTNDGFLGKIEHADQTVFKVDVRGDFLKTIWMMDPGHGDGRRCGDLRAERNWLETDVCKATINGADVVRKYGMHGSAGTAFGKAS